MNPGYGSSIFFQLCMKLLYVLKEHNDLHTDLNKKWYTSTPSCATQSL